MALPFRPVRGKTVEIPYRTAVIRADPDFEWGKRHEPFYEFSNGRRFDENTAKHGAYNFVPVSITLTLQGNAASATAGHLEPQTDAGISAFLSGVEGDTALGTLGFTNETPVALTAVSGSASAGLVTPFGQSVINASVNLLGINASGALGILSVTGNSNDSANMLGLVATGALGTIAISSTSNANTTLIGRVATGAIGAITINIVNGSVSASVNMPKVTATGALGVINQGQLQQPIMTLTSVAGVTNPTFTFTLDPAIVAGDTMTFQEQVDGGDWSSPVANVVHTFTSGEIAAGEVDLGLVARTNGTYDARMLVTHGAVNSAWSNVIVFTVSVASAGTPLGALLTITH